MTNEIDMTFRQEKKNAAIKENKNTIFDLRDNTTHQAINLDQLSDYSLVSS